MPDNTITVVGNITRAPDLTFTPAGQALCKLGIAVNRRWQDKASGSWKEETSFFDVDCWRELAENIAESLSKGDRVVVTGRLEQRTWEAEDGSKRSAVSIQADEVAPSLRWATARVEKTERRSGNGAASPAPSMSI